MGTLPWRDLDLPPGEYTVLVRSAGYADAQQDITLAADERKTVPIRLQPGQAGGPVEPPIEPPADGGAGPGDTGANEQTLALEAEIDAILAIRVPAERQAALRELVAENREGERREALIQASIRVSQRIDAMHLLGLMQETAFDPKSHHLIQEFLVLCRSDPRVGKAFTDLLKRQGITKPPFSFPGMPPSFPLPFPLPFPGMPGGGEPGKPPAPGTTPTFPFPIPDNLLPPADRPAD